MLGRTLTAVAGVNITWALADVDALPFTAATFDAITSCFGVMLAADPPAAVAEMARVLRPGGRIALVS
jgi:ubiquinone/menaquinone biosynthesis C-methylase UbiE